MLFPLALIYRVIIWVRNKLFDYNILKSASFNFPLICVGNLAVGGTGKTPMTELIVELLKDEFKMATLSRGYKRRTKGFAVANANTTALEIGDEPMQFHKKYPEMIVAVGEERLFAIPQILSQFPETQTIILDDAFQHRSVKSGLNIILTDYNNLYTRDLMFPAGDLRDMKSSSKRAEVIVVTKCKSDLNADKKMSILKELKPLPQQEVFFTSITYGNPYHMFDTQKKLNLTSSDHVLLVCGIANPGQIKKYLSNIVYSYEMIKFPDHHIFTTDDLQEIKSQFSKMLSDKKFILTTEKDAVRLEKFKEELVDFPIYVLPIKHQFLFDDEVRFVKILKTYIQSFGQKKELSHLVNN